MNAFCHWNFNCFISIVPQQQRRITKWIIKLLFAVDNRLTISSNVVPDSSVFVCRTSCPKLAPIWIVEEETRSFLSPDTGASCSESVSQNLTTNGQSILLAKDYSIHNNDRCRFDLRQRQFDFCKQHLMKGLVEEWHATNIGCCSEIVTVAIQVLGAFLVLQVCYTSMQLAK